MSKLSGKIAVITGGNSGIGYSTAEELKAQGAEVVITGRSQERVEAAAQELGVRGLVADVSDLGQIDALVEDVKGIYGKVDVLFVNAGVYVPSQIGDLDEKGYDYQMDINFKGAVFTIEKFLPILNEGASIINLASVVAYAGMAGSSIYAATKAALLSYTRTAATELAPRGIRVNAVNPGPVATPIFSKTGMPEEQLKGFAEVMQNSVPLKRFGEPQEVAKLVSFLASDDAAYITGGEYNIDGGIAVPTLLN
ncbi:MAG: SDR family oxidoreductase [Bacteroidota bacterium]